MNFFMTSRDVMHENATHELLDDEEKVVSFPLSDYGRSPGKSPDMNPPERVGAIMQEKIENALLDVSSKRH